MEEVETIVVIENSNRSERWKFTGNISKQCTLKFLQMNTHQPTSFVCLLLRVQSPVFKQNVDLKKLKLPIKTGADAILL